MRLAPTILALSFPLMLGAALIHGPVNAQEAQAISLEGQAIELLPVDFQVFRLSMVARLILTTRNNTSEFISSWRVMAYFTDPFGDEMFKIQLTSGKANIPPGETSEVSFDFEDNRLLDKEPFDHLASYDANKIHIRLDSIRVVN